MFNTENKTAVLLQNLAVGWRRARYAQPDARSVVQRIAYLLEVAGVIVQ